MFVRDDPAAGILAESDGQAEVEASPLPGLRRLAVHPRAHEGDVAPGGDLHVVEVEDDRILRRREEEVPGPSVLFEFLRLERRGTSNIRSSAACPDRIAG